MKIWLKPDPQGGLPPEEVRVVTGDYDRTFSRADEPFQVTEEEWLKILIPAGKFTADKPAKRKPAAAPREAAPAPEAPPEGSSKAKEG